MSITFQEAGEFVNTQGKVYFSDKFALYFYNVALDPSEPIITNSFQYITEEEYGVHRLFNGEEFFLYENDPCLKEVTFDMSVTNVKIPVEAVEECIDRFTEMFSTVVTASKGIDDMKRLNLVDEEVSNIVM